MSNNHRNEEEWIGFVALLVLVALLFLAFMVVQAIALVGRTTAAHGNHRTLRIGWVVALVATLPALLTAGHFVALDIVAALGLAQLIAAAWGVETYYDTLFKRALTRERLVHEVLGPWW